MLYVELGRWYDKADQHINSKHYFNNAFEPEWMEDDMVKAMVEDIDKSKVISPRIIESPYLGDITPKQLSTGVKGLILMRHHPEFLYVGNFFGDNCSPWILEMAKTNDIRMTLGYLMDFKDLNGKDEFEITIVNTGKVVRTNKEFVLEAIDYI